MAIAFGSISSTSYASRTNTTITAPSGISDGDLLLFFILTGTATEAVDPTPPGGLTAIGTATEQDHSAFNVETRAYYRVASGESGDYTFTHTASSSQGVCVRYTGVDTTTPMDATATQRDWNISDVRTTSIANGITTVTNDAMLVMFEHDWGDNAAASTPPTGMTERLDSTLSYVADVSQAVAGASGDKSFTNSNTANGWATRLIALRPGATSTVEQEGFRFRNDDGSETSATWKAAQDSNTTAPLSANLRLRTLVNATGDPAALAYTLRYKKSTDGTYLPVNVGSSIPQTAPVVESVAESSVNTAGTSHAVTLPASIASTDLVLITMDIGSTSATLNSLTDWGEILDESAANGLKILWYTGAGVPSTPTFTSSGSTRSASIAWRISNADKTVTPQIGTTATGTSTTPDPPSVTPSAGSKPYLFIAFYGAAGEEADDDTWSDTPPTNYLPSPPYQKSCGTAGTNLGGLIAAASRQLTTGSAEDPGTFAKDVSAAWRAQTIIVHPAVPDTPPIYVATSSNITGGGEATTVQLTAPSGKSTSDFVTGRMWDDENGTDTIDITTDDYTELEWCLQAQSPAANADIYQFRVYAGSTALDTYTVTPEWTIGAGGDGTATPAVIVGSFTVPAATTQAGSVPTPAVIARAATLPAANASGHNTTAPAVIARAATVDAPTTAAGSAPTPAVIARSVVLPAPSTGAAGNAAPDVIARAATLPAPTTQAGAVPTPAVIARSATLPAPSTGVGATGAPAVIPLAVVFDTAAIGGSVTLDAIARSVVLPAPTTGGSGTRSPTVITVPVTIPAATPQAGSTASPAVSALTVAIPSVTTTGGTGATATPAVTALTVTIPPVTTSAGAVTTPAVMPLSVTIPQASASGAAAGTATPATVTAVVTLPGVTARADSTATPAVTSIPVTMPALNASGSRTIAPGVITIPVTIGQAASSGGTSDTATPNAIAVITVLPAPTLQYGYVVNPAAIQLAVAIGAAIAQGLEPDAHPVTVTMRDAGHTITVRVTGATATVRTSGSTATAREQR